VAGTGSLETVIKNKIKLKPIFCFDTKAVLLYCPEILRQIYQTGQISARGQSTDGSGLN